MSLNIEYSVECQIFRWMDFCYWILNIPLNVEFSVECIFVIACWIFYWILNFPKNSCLIAVGLIFIIEHWIFRWLLSLNFHSEFLLHNEFFLNIEISIKFYYWTLNLCWKLQFYLNIEFPNTEYSSFTKDWILTEH